MILWTSEGGIGRWNLTKVEERIFGGDCRGGLYAQLGLWKWRRTYYFVENSAHFALEIDLLLTVLSNFEREVALDDTHREKLCFTQFSTRHGCLAASHLFHMFTHSNKFYTFHYHVLRVHVWKMWFIK